MKKTARVCNLFSTLHLHSPEFPQEDLVCIYSKHTLYTIHLLYIDIYYM